MANKWEERSRLLAELDRIHEEWKEEMTSQVTHDEADSDPHTPGESDYNEHYVARSATPEQEKVFQDRIKDVLDKLSKL